MDLLVDRSDLRVTRLVDPGVPEPADGEAVLAVDTFALTANTITYGAVGDLIGYWRFFPAGDGWGRIPAWGFADVVASRCEDLPIGARVYGFLPMATHLRVLPVKVTPRGFVDGAAHRAALPPVYNQYSRVDRAPETDEAVTAVLRPLFTTAFLIDAWLADEGWFGADQVVVTSASSKTSIGLAHLVHARGVPTVGLTSARNVAAVSELGCYDTVLAYDTVLGGATGTGAGLPVVATVSVDVAGDPAVLAGIHRHLGDALRVSSLVGLTHWEARAGGAAPGAGPLPGPTPAMFFAPDHVLRRREAWGARGFDDRLAAAWDTFAAFAATWLRIETARGPEAVVAAYRAVLEGAVEPTRAVMASLHA
jgi:hypothetical protein